MNKFYCDNCKAEMSEDNTRHIWYKSYWWAENEHYNLDLCDKCYHRFTKHLRRLVYKYKNSSRRF